MIGKIFFPSFVNFGLKVSLRIPRLLSGNSFPTFQLNMKEKSYLSSVQISRVTLPNELLRIAKVFEEELSDDNSRYGHVFGGLSSSRLENMIISGAIYNIMPQLKIWCAYKSKDPVALIIFAENIQLFSDEKVCSEVHWISKDKISGIKLLKYSIKALSVLGFNYVLLSSIENHPCAERLRKFYILNGLEKEAEIYSLRLKL